MNLSELVQVYGAGKSDGQDVAQKSGSGSAPAKKAGAGRSSKPRRPEKTNQRQDRGPPPGVYAPQMVPHPYPVPYPYDPSMMPAYPSPMFYGPPMMMIYPPGAGTVYAAPPMPGIPTSGVQSMPIASSAPSSSAPSIPSEHVPTGPVPFGPNFVAPSYVPSYMYPYDSSYQTAYGPPKKRAKRPTANNRQGGAASSNRPPPSPGSDSAESSSSATSALAVEKPVKPKKFHCEPCEKSFKTQELYEVHLTTHFACSHEGCKYSASKGALKMHELLHTHNMFAKLSTPEEIAKYRDERRKRFPSVVKQQEMQEAKEKEKEAKQAAIEKAQQQRLAQRAARAAAAAPASENGSKEVDVDADAEPSAISSKDDPNPDLMDDLAPQRANARGKRKRPVCKYWRQGHCNKGEQCSFSHANDTERPERGRPEKQKRNTPTAPSKPGPQTLLSQFLQSEISKEHQLILQCLRYIVQNDFFKPNSSHPIPAPSSEADDINNAEDQHLTENPEPSSS